MATVTRKKRSKAKRGNDRATDKSRDGFGGYSSDSSADLNLLLERSSIKSSTGKKPSTSEQAKKDTVVSSTVQKSSKSGQAKKNTPQSSAEQKRSKSKLVKDPVESSSAKKRLRSGQDKKDTAKSSTGHKGTRTGEIKNSTTKSSTSQKRTMSGQVKHYAKTSVSFETLDRFSKYVAKCYPLIFEKLEGQEAYDKYIRWLNVAKKHVPNRRDYLKFWANRKAKDLEYETSLEYKDKSATFESFDLAPYETPEAFYNCVGKHFPLIFERLEYKTAYELFMLWLEKAKGNVLDLDPRIYIIHWMELIAESYGHAEGDESKVGTSKPKYKWVRCKDRACPHKISDEPEKGHTHFYNKGGNPVTETLMLWEVGLVTFNAIMPAGKDWAEQLPHYPTNPTIRRRYALWTEEDQKALLASKGLLRKFIEYVDDEEQRMREEEEDAKAKNAKTARAGRARQNRNAPMPVKAPKAPEAPQPATDTATDPNAQTTETAVTKAWGAKKAAVKTPRFVGCMLSKAEQDQFCKEYYESELKKGKVSKKPAKPMFYKRLPENMPDGPYPRKTDYYHYGSKEPEEDMDTRAKFNLPLSAKQYAKYYEKYRLAKEDDKIPPYDRDWLQKAGIHEGAASSESTSLCGISGIKSEDFEQCGVLVPDDILYIRYNEAAPPVEAAGSKKGTKSKKKAKAPVIAISEEESATRKSYTSHETYTHEISGRLIGFDRNKQVHLHVNGFEDKDGDPLVIKCQGPTMIHQIFAMLAPGINTSRAEPVWQMIEVRSKTGEEFGSLYRVRQHYELFKAEMDEWAEHTGVEWRKMVKNSVAKKEAARLKRAEGVKNGDFVKGKGKGKRKSKEEKEAEAKKREEMLAKREALAKKKEEVIARREAQAKEKGANPQAAKSKGKGTGSRTLTTPAAEKSVPDILMMELYD